MAVSPIRSLWARRIAKQRVACGLTHAALAQRVGCDESAISRIELGQRGVNDEMKLRIANALEIHPGELFAWEPPITKEPEQWSTTTSSSPNAS